MKHKEKNILLNLTGILAIIIVSTGISGCINSDREPQILDVKTSTGVFPGGEPKNITKEFTADSQIHICAKVTASYGATCAEIKIYSAESLKVLEINSLCTEGDNVWLCANLTAKEGRLNPGNYSVEFIFGNKVNKTLFTVIEDVPEEPQQPDEVIKQKPAYNIAGSEEVKEFLKLYPKTKFTKPEQQNDAIIVKIYSDEGKINHTLYVKIDKISGEIKNTILENTGGFCPPEQNTPETRSVTENQTEFLKNEKKCVYDSDCFAFNAECYNFQHIEKYKETNMCDRGIGCECIKNTCMKS